MTARSTSARVRAIAGATSIFVVAVVVYLPVLHSNFLSDDFGFLAEAASGERFRMLFWAVPRFIRPVAIASLFLDHALFGLHPEGGHLTNMLLHALSALLVAGIARRILGSGAAALAAGLLFAVQPVHPEAVSWISGRFDVLCGFFALSCILAYVEYRTRAAAGWLVASVVLLVLAVLSKEAALSLPAVLVAYELSCRRDRKLVSVLPHLACVAAYFVVRVEWMGGLGGYQDAAGRSLALPHTIRAWLEGILLVPIRTLVAPLNQLVWGQVLYARLAGALIAVHLILAVTAVLALRNRRFGRELGFVLAFLPLATLPAAGLLSSGIDPDLEGTRMLYLPSAGYCLAMSALLLTLPRSLFRPALGLLVGTCAVLVLGNEQPWREAGALSRSILRQVEERYPHIGCSEKLLVVRDPPDKVRGAVVFRNHLETAIWLFHPEHPRVIIEQGAPTPDAVELERSSCFVARWRADLGRLEDTTPRAGARDLVLRWEGAAALGRWQARGAEVRSGDPSVLQLEVDGDDPTLESPLMSTCTSLLRAELRVSPTGPKSDHVLDVFWAPDGQDFSAEHLQSVALYPDGADHSYLVPLVKSPAELGGATRMRVRLDPSSFPSQVSVRSIELVPCWPAVVPGAVVVESRGLSGDPNVLVDGRVRAASDSSVYAVLGDVRSFVVVRAPDRAGAGLLVGAAHGDTYRFACSRKGSDFDDRGAVTATASEFDNVVLPGPPFDSRACRYVRVTRFSGAGPFRLSEVGFLDSFALPVSAR
jgi:Dolichyl-phosphate-mannose-protein mannosyltransferase